ncbi:thiamine pyrophosphate-dependent dehydrogenase E1 component subunit alpha [Novosphingobium pentaromativorans]|uniref:Pyruvate dehydrogenase (Acetyl-transferring) n=1 Tax=Novosphingobium pentaromativorans US6-1 TaxID=1088721 RepID=G6ED58_9SPHN|nr:thiamine pyrophosphate-dependent dehydrogenase E1 component subunit alpha [Novosphingobium pentaromativorans]AIT79846.1 pyruvate dehydrogenase [Novosphingobium pentaromativorans US6-1]EHJ60770.1 Pyruvate dehydrogenase (acetyl-transferring) [Novosphingobium pentaromativorans US6-1]
MQSSSEDARVNRAIPDAETQLEIYRRMALIARNDEVSRKVIKTGRLMMPYYSPRGQEVIPSALSVNLNHDDQICTIYRGTHDMLAKGVPLRDLWAEVAGRVTGTCKGKGGPMHITHPASGAILTTGIVGSSMPIANGLAWAHKLDGSKRVVIAYFGDAASNIGAFHESLNLASLWKLPVIFVCQNNLFGEHTRYENATSVDQVSKRSASYSMPGVTVDGNDPIEMYAAAHEAIARAREGGGPTLIEAMTFRFHGHVFGDDDSYMTKEEKAAAIAKDPVPAFRAKLIADGIATEEDLAAMEKTIADDIEDAVQYALGSDLPHASELTTDVYAEAGVA